MSRGKFIGEGRSRILDLSEIKTYDSHDRAISSASTT